MSTMDINFPSWRVAADVFDEAAAAAPASLCRVVAETTDPGACRAATGPSTVDAAVAVMLTAFGEVMRGTVATSLGEGLRSEADALAETGAELREMEDDNSALAESVEEEL